MKKTGKKHYFQESSHWKKTALAMKMTLLFLLVNLFVVSANDGFAQSQKISFKTKNSTVVEALNLLRANAGMKVLYSPEELNNSTSITVDLKNASIEDVLNEVLKNQTVGFVVDGDKIIISQKRYIEPSTSVAMQQKVSVKGIVTDTKGEPLPGVSVSVKGTTQGTVTDFNGQYSIDVPTGNSTLVFQFLGMASQEVKVDGKSSINIKLAEDSQAVEEVMVVGYGKQKKVSVVGSIESIGVKELKVPTSNISNSFAGRLAGVIAFQRSGEPGADGSNFYIRGISTFSGATNPLIILDGMQVSQGDLNSLSPEVIESFSILKDATATALYGTRGANGVMIVTTKSGKDMDKAKINIRVENMFSTPTSVPNFVGGAQFMDMYNEAVNGRGTGEIPYGQEKIDGTRQGLDKYIYPDVDWYNELFKNLAMNQSANMNVMGGGKKADYFMNLAVNVDNGVLKKFNLNSYDNNIKVQRYAFQNNINTYLTPSTRLSLRMNTTLRDYHGPAVGASDIFGLVMQANPVDFPIMFPQQEGVDHIMYGGKAGGRFNDGYRNPFAEMTKGYSDNFQSTVIASLDGEQKLDFVTKGLVFRAMASFKNWSSTTVTRSSGYNQYAVGSPALNADGTYKLDMVGNIQGTTLATTSSTTGDRWLYYQAQMQYDRTFNQIHSVSAMAVYNQDEYNTNNPANLISSLPKRKQGLASRVTYGFDDRYLAEFNFGYNGSENFAKGHRFGFFPSVALGYVVSNESYWQPIEHIIPWFKIRGSWGKVGNDQIGGDRFLYLSDVNLTGSGYTTGLNLDYSKSGPVYNRYANNSLSWEEGEKTNIGFDMGLFHKVNVAFDVYKEHRTGIFLTRGVIPTSFGTDGTNIYGNLGEVENKGVDVSVDFNHKFSDDFSMQLKGTFTYSHNEVLDKDEPPFSKYPNLSAVGRPVNTLWGYVAERLFIDQAEINNSPLQQLGGTVMPGDIKYTNITKDQLGYNDNLINSDDRVAMGHPTIPEIVYGFGPSFQYKKFDFSFYFQGVARTSFFVNGFHPFGTTEIRNVLKFIADDYWSAENPNPYAKYPRLSKLDHPNNTSNSSFWLRNGAFLKLKNIEVGYTYKFARFYMTGLNALTFSKFKEWDPEQGGGNGLGYPTQRVFSVGLQIQL